MGMMNDQKRRTKLARVDDHVWKYNIWEARKALYEEHGSIASANVNKTLNAQSLVPTEVSNLILGLVIRPDY